MRHHTPPVGSETIRSFSRTLPYNAKCVIEYFANRRTMERKRTSKIVRQLRGGQITIPAEFRKRLGIDSLLQMTLAGDELRRLQLLHRLSNRRFTKNLLRSEKKQANTATRR